MMHRLAVDAVGVAVWALLAGVATWAAASAVTAAHAKVRQARALIERTAAWRDVHSRACALRLWQEASEAEEYFAAWLDGNLPYAEAVVARVEHERRMANGLPPVTAGDVAIPDGMPDDRDEAGQVPPACA